MTKVLITNTYFYKLDPKQWRFKQPYPPLGTLQAAAVVRQAGIDLSFFDSSLEERPEDIERVLQKERPDYLVIYDDGFNYLTKMCLTVMREAAFTMASRAQRLGCKVIINSSDSTDHYREYLETGFDFVVRGEGEETLKELLLCLSHAGDTSQIKGIAFRPAGSPVVTDKRPVMRDLDSLPPPAWDLINLAPYQAIWKAHHGYFSLNIATTRGCPFKCNWCAKPIYGNRYNSRSPEHVVREIEWLLLKYQPDHFWMCDDIFGLKPDWISRFYELVVEKKLLFRYKIQSRADLILEKETIVSLAHSGCETVWLGAESGSQKILDAMDKGIKVGQTKEAAKLLRQHGIKTGFFIQFGYPGETSQDIDATLAMVLEVMPDEIGISVSYPLPGTRFYENVKSQLHSKSNWIDSDDLAMLYQSTFPHSYYKILQRYVHSRYRIQRGLNRLKDFTRKPNLGADGFKKIASMVYHVPILLFHSYRLKRLGSIHA